MSEKQTMSNKKPTVHVGITDYLSPDVKAMCMAKYSRDASPIMTRLPDEQKTAKEHRAALRKYYVGYGHKSIGQCASTDTFIEGVSLLAAKAIEDTPLFNGQECSTRYIDMTHQPCISTHDEISQWQQTWKSLYTVSLKQVQESLKQLYPYEQQEHTHKNPELIYENTIKARAFDICRGLLPAGITTNVGASLNFDVMNSHFSKLLHHPLQEVRGVAADVLYELQATYPDVSFGAQEASKRFSYATEVYFYQNLDLSKQYLLVRPCGVDFHETIRVIENKGMRHQMTDYSSRQKGELLDPYTSSLMRATYHGRIDYGSYRDIHRHRNGVTSMPILTPLIGMHHYYVENLPKGLQEILEQTYKTYLKWYKESELSTFEKQYSTPIGCVVDFTMQCDINQALYVIEMRSSKTVHQTLRQLVWQWADELRYLGVHFIFEDREEDNFTLKRGTQTYLET